MYILEGDGVDEGSIDCTEKKWILFEFSMKEEEEESDKGLSHVGSSRGVHMQPVFIVFPFCRRRYLHPLPFNILTRSLVSTDDSCG